MRSLGASTRRAIWCLWKLMCEDATSAMTVVINWRNSCLNGSGEVVWVPSYFLREIGAGAALRPREVRELFLGFDAWEPSVRVAALRDVIASLEEDDERAKRVTSKRHR